MSKIVLTTIALTVAAVCGLYLYLVSGTTPDSWAVAGEIAVAKSFAIVYLLLVGIGVLVKALSWFPDWLWAGSQD